MTISPVNPRIPTTNNTNPEEDNKIQNIEQHPIQQHSPNEKVIVSRNQIFGL